LASQHHLASASVTKARRIMVVKAYIACRRCGGIENAHLSDIRRHLYCASAAQHAHQQRSRAPRAKHLSKNISVIVDDDVASNRYR